jgi:hypothetical protein
MLPNIWKIVALFAGFQKSPTPTYGKSSIRMNLMTEHEQNDTERGNRIEESNKRTL